ncbi:hypothetical protein QYE76_027663 [Lolium multiflorum]|uniref:Uncharacterized protein n=1 Tax=Lolium multiflorum TaxID=4521 RepID=A0AAD8QJI8_LOLMU|nr:hypothetical protein QYE76_027663 [Lolium multiflorum]
MKMAVKMAAVSMEKPSGHFSFGGVPNRDSCPRSWLRDGGGSGSRYLEGYVDGTYPCPSPYDPAYHAWVAQDQAILSAIQSSLTESVSSLVIFAATSREAWGALHASFASQSHARAHAIRNQLGEVKLLDRSITDYFNKVTGLADTLAAIGQPLRPEDFTSYVMNGLDEDYDNLCENIEARETPIQPRELYACLLATEQRVKKKHAVPSTANAAHRGGGKTPKTPAGGGKPPTAPSPAQQPSPAARPLASPLGAARVLAAPAVVLSRPASCARSASSASRGLSLIDVRPAGVWTAWRSRACAMHTRRRSRRPGALCPSRASFVARHRTGLCSWIHAGLRHAAWDHSVPCAFRVWAAVAQSCITSRDTSWSVLARHGTLVRAGLFCIGHFVCIAVVLDRHGTTTCSRVGCSSPPYA